MSQIDAFNSLQQTITPNVNRFQDMKSEDFIKIIFTELSNQDPFKPNDSAALLEQLNSIRSIESDIQLVDKLDSLVTQNQMASAGTLIGRYVTGLTDSAQRVSGYVVSANRQGDNVRLSLDSGLSIGFDQLEVVKFDDRF